MLAGRRVAAILLLVILVRLVLPAAASDDSNSNNLGMRSKGGISPQALSSTLASMGKGVNDTGYARLLSQFETALNSGNRSSASSILSQLQSYPGAQSNPSISPALVDLLESLVVTANGASVNSSLLSQLLQLNKIGSNGVPQGLSGESPTLAGMNIEQLASLLQSVNPSMASSLLSLISPLVGGSGYSTHGSMPTLQNIPKAALGVPSLSPPIPQIGLSALYIPVAALLVLSCLFVGRKKLADLFRGLLAKTGRKGGLGFEEPFPSDPRGKVAYYFRRAVATMGFRGVRKGTAETHREFSCKCAGRPEEGNIGSLASLYEKASFSGRAVSEAEVLQAGNDCKSVESGAPK